MSHTIIAAANCPIYKDYPYLLRNLAPRNRTDGRMTVRLATLVLLAAALLAFACGSDDDAAPATGSGPRDVIAFGAEGPDGDGLYIVKPDGSGLRLLAAESGFVAFPVWSPGGGQIAYVVGVPGGVDPVLLRVYDFETDTPVTVSTLAVAGQFGAPAAWSPDGRQIAFSEVAGGAPRLRVYDVGRGELIDYPRVSGRSPTWSPDGEELAFVRDGGDGGLLVMDAGGGEPEVLVNRPGRVEGPRWSPGGELIVVVAGEEGAEALLLVERASGAVTELGRGLAPSWSPDSGRIVFSAPSEDGETDLDIFFVAVEGGARQPLSQSITRDLWPAWSPDGNSVAHLSQADRQTAFICIVRLQPEARDCLELPGLLPTTPAWAPR